MGKIQAELDKPCGFLGHGPRRLWVMVVGDTQRELAICTLSPVVRRRPRQQPRWMVSALAKAPHS